MFWTTQVFAMHVVLVSYINNVVETTKEENSNFVRYIGGVSSVRMLMLTRIEHCNIRAG